MIKSKAVMIGAGIANMAAAVYLIQEGHWNPEDITFYALDKHGSMMVQPLQKLPPNTGIKITLWKIQRGLLHGAVGC